MSHTTSFSQASQLNPFIRQVNRLNDYTRQLPGDVKMGVKRLESSIFDADDDQSYLVQLGQIEEVKG